MLTDRWLTAIGSATQTIFWAIGYFFGFTLVSALSFGLLLPGPFPDIGKPRKHGWHLFYKQEGKIYLVSEAVAAIGWVFVSLLNWFVFYLTTG